MWIKMWCTYKKTQKYFYLIYLYLRKQNKTSIVYLVTLYKGQRLQQATTGFSFVLAGEHAHKPLTVV